MYFFYFFPLGLDRKSTRLPLVTRVLTLVMLVTFVWIRYWPDRGPCDPWSLVFYPGNGAPWTAVTAIFLHASWWHLLGNLLYLNVFGPPLEDRLGFWLFTFLFLMVGTFGNLVHGIVSVWGLMGQQGVGVLGASGALAGLLSFSLVRFYDARVKIGWWVFAPLAGQNRAGKSYIPILPAIAGWLLLQVVNALVAGETGAGVSYGAHLGGFFLGLVLAAILGQLKAGRIESRKVLAARYFQQGEFFAAAGCWTEFLDFQPGNIEGLLGRARTRRTLGQNMEALSDYRQVLISHLNDREVDEALEVFREVHRAELSRTLPPDLLVQVATLMEKQMDYEGALAAYRELYESYPDHSSGQRALVRLVHLYHGKLEDATEAARWLQVACRHLPGGSWREYLAREFSGAKEHCADDSANPPEPHPSTKP